jgi:hypothetical protein
LYCLATTFGQTLGKFRLVKVCQNPSYDGVAWLSGQQINNSL